MSKPDLAYQLRRHERKRRADRLLTVLFYSANLLGLPTMMVGAQAMDSQYCARDPLCNMTPVMRRQTIAQEDDARQLGEIAYKTGIALVAGNFVYYLNSQKTNR